MPSGTGGAINVFASNAGRSRAGHRRVFRPGHRCRRLRLLSDYPCRAADTRNATASLGGPALAGGKSRTFPILSAPACNLPASVKAYALNLAAIPKGPLGYVTAWASGQSQPAASSLNAPTGTVTANAAIVQAGSSGAINVFASNDTDLVIDITGYFAPAAAGALSLFTMPACRALDASQPGGTPRDVAAGDNCGIPSAAQAYVLSATVVPAGALGYLTLWPQGQTQPIVVDAECGGCGGHIEPGDRAHIEQEHQRVPQQSNSPGAGYVRILRAVIRREEAAM